MWKLQQECCRWRLPHLDSYEAPQPPPATGAAAALIAAVTTYTADVTVCAAADEASR